MYRIEVVPGEETVFRTMEELAVGIRNGLITPRARIYHNASQKWLPIGLHPHYKKAMELPAASSAHPKTPTPVPAKAPSKPRVESHTVESHIAERPAEPTPAPAPRVPAPVMSPVVAMQQEVLRDLPVVVIPEPLPWARRPAPVEPVAPPPPPDPIVPIAQPVQSPPTATVTYTPSPQPEPVQPEPVQPEPVQPEPVQPEPVSPWPHFEPMEESHARPTARRSKRAGGRPLLLVGIAAALVAAAHFALNATPSTSADSSDGAEPEEELVTERVAAEAPAEEPAVKVLPAPTAATPPRVTSSPARVRMTPGPAFAGSVPAQPGVDTVAPRAKVPVAPATSAPADPDAAAPSIAPAPVELLALPDLKTDSVAPTRAAGDTMAMKKILRALNGSKR